MQSIAEGMWDGSLDKAAGKSPDSLEQFCDGQIDCLRNGLQGSQAGWCAPKWLAANLRETDKLIADWSHFLSARFASVLDEAMEAARVKVAIATAPLEYLKWIPEQVGAVASTFTWKELENRFQELQAKATGHKFSATFTRTDWESGGVSEEWIVGGTPALRKEFEHLASIAARTLFARSMMRSKAARIFFCRFGNSPRA